MVANYKHLFYCQSNEFAKTILFGMQKNNIYEIQEKWQKYWIKYNTYLWDHTKSKLENFSIDTPPPTISGTLHMGHVFSYTQTDFIARFQRMLGKNVYYPIGFDHNGLPTEKLTEKIKQIKAKNYTKKEFDVMCSEVTNNLKKEFIKLLKTLGISFDWSQEYSTLNNTARQISQMSFIDLFNKKLIYRDHAPCFWDIEDQTAISQAEIVDHEATGIIYDIYFYTTEGKQIIISTTRPELLPACVAIFYHPNDNRYRDLHSKIAISPIFNKHINLIPDVDVIIEKGSGLVMCCTFGDTQDIIWWKRYRLPIISCIDRYGKMSNSNDLNGLTILKARTAIVQKLYQKHLIAHQKTIKHKIKYSERSNSILEIITSNQWFVNILAYQKELTLLSAQCTWKPHFMWKKIDNWIKGLNQNWCISRQRHFGIPFPIWYSNKEKEAGKILLPDISDLPIDPFINSPKGYDRKEVIPESDVMDTWATSALTPQITSLYLSKNLYIKRKQSNKFFPFNLRAQGHDIINTWAFYTIVKSFFHYNNKPWDNLMISGWCKTKENIKMSKSKNNAINPKKVLDQYGADIVRYWASHTKLGTDVIFNEATFKIGEKLIKKLYNASRLYYTHTNKIIKVSIKNLKDDIKNKKIVSGVDKWILSSLKKTIFSTTILLQDYTYSEARSCIEEFFWNDLCDNYLELIKKRLYNTTEVKSRSSALITLGYILKTVLKLLAPYLPYITDEINAQLFYDIQSINSISKWPQINDYYYNKQDIDNGNMVKAILHEVRKYKSQRNMSLNSAIHEITYEGCFLHQDVILDLKSACNCEIISVIKKQLFRVSNISIGVSHTK